MSEKATATLPGTVQRIIKPPHPDLPEKAEIAVEMAGRRSVKRTNL